MNHRQTPLEIGKYLISSTAQEAANGAFSASVSIRSGKGSGTHDRIVRFSAPFESAAAALRYATEQALAWIGERNTPAWR
jgi:hypothetical protein